MRIKKIHIDRMRDTIVIERPTHAGISAGSRLYCGCCGNILGVVKKDQSFPCGHLDLIKNMEDVTFDAIPMGRGLRHKTCGHVMFMFSTSWGFSTLEMYYSWRKENAPNHSHGN